MGRQAKLRQQRKQAERSPSVADTPKTSRSGQTPPKSQSFLGKFIKRLNPFSKEKEDLSWLEDERDYTEENQRLVGAIAWEGYQKHKRGVVFAREIENAPVELEYIPRKLFKKTLRQRGVTEEDMKEIEALVNSYDPEQSVVSIYCDLNGEITASMPTLDPPPPECERLMRELEEE